VKFLTALFLAMMLAWSAARARTEVTVDMDSDAKARITLGSCFDNVTVNGYAPIDITINNHSGATRQWTFDFSSPGYSYGDMDNMASTFNVSVENNSTRTIPVIVPMSIGSRGYSTPLQVRVNGYGCKGGVEQTFGANNGSGKTPTSYVVMSESLGTSIWSSLTSQLQSSGRDLAGSTVNPQDLPDDWRGLTGVSELWLTGNELNDLSATQRYAVVTWVHTGGRLMLCGAPEIPDDLKWSGFGETKLLPAKLNLNQAEELIKVLPTYTNAPGNDTTSNAQYYKLQNVKPNVALLGSFMACFGLLVGPLNIFFIGRKRRERLLWTTPLMSIGASALLFGIIAMQDGAGGHGYRSAVICLSPHDHNAVVIQEQMSRTGLLLGSAFETRDPVWMSHLDLPTTNQQGRSLRVDGKNFSSAWFTSRAFQVQRLVSAVPTRAEITLLNGGDVANGAAPIIESSMDSPLKNLMYVDSQHRMWKGANIETGEKQTLAPAAQSDWTMIHLPAGAGDSLRSHVDDPNLFWATAEQSTDYIATLNSIHWTDAPVTYVGPVTVNP
jgi:hypothetical protein